MFFLLFFLSLLIFFSTIGYGFIFLKLFKLENFNYNFGIVGITGLFFLSIISSYSHLLFPHNYIHNIIIIIVWYIFIILIKLLNLKK